MGRNGGNSSAGPWAVGDRRPPDLALNLRAMDEPLKLKVAHDLIEFATLEAAVQAEQDSAGQAVGARVDGGQDGVAAGLMLTAPDVGDERQGGRLPRRRQRD